MAKKAKKETTDSTEQKKTVVKKTTKKKDNNVIEVKIAKNISQEMYGVPKYAHDGDLGMDVIATGVDYDYVTDSYMYHTGIYMESDKHVGCFLFPRSSNKKTEAYLANSIGLIETFIYRGEICFCYKNRDSFEQRIYNRIFQQYMALPWYKKLFFNYDDYKELYEIEFEFQNKPDVSLAWAPYKVGEKIGQLVFFKDIPTVKLKVVDKTELSQTDRGENGFGSTGN